MLFPLYVFATDICPAGYYPAEYVELEYIESTGTQYIDTGLFGGLDTFGIQGAFYITYDSSGKYYVLGNFNQNGQAGIMVDTSYTNKIIFRYYNTDKTKGYSVLLGNTYQKFLISTIGRKVLLDSNYINDIPENTAKLTNSKLMLFGTGIGQRFNAGGRVYFLEIYDGLSENSTKIRDFIPVRRFSDGEIGMYDRVEGKFYRNDGTGEFIAGPEVQSFIIDENNITCVSCPANTYKPNAGNTECTKCPEHTFSPVGSTSLSDCAKILRVKDYVVYMPLGKRTEHGLCVMSDGKKYCADVYERQ